MAGNGDEETEFLMEQVKKLELMEKRTKELVEQRKLERQCLEMECLKMERQKKYLLAMLRENEDAEEQDRLEQEAKKPFHGAGNILGAPSPVQRVESVQPVRNMVKPIEIDESKPKGNIQVRLGDGGRLVLTLNLTHTIRDLKQEVQARQPPEVKNIEKNG
ncbi:UBX domain-containing protein 3 isoform X2 [Eurytemora carolleeae]|uniref:UBX domain-containing protein 3 isoform X2 n=1 Tax=Eurytemora carolleeae TaxID=1294199 RepID=UPI000C76E001|nr:UBX domain-containing protein 3 isoform X2 [Eurytemora carolleeae]|eukprot:XP_023333136.1 UBX domain-containing protein 3-like isoform X2 [Eurytemora affinis]